MARIGNVELGNDDFLFRELYEYCVFYVKFAFNHLGARRYMVSPRALPFPKYRITIALLGRLHILVLLKRMCSTRMCACRSYGFPQCVAYCRLASRITPANPD